MANRTQPRVANAPDYRIVVDGTVITPTVRGYLNRLTLTDNRGGEADRLELTLNDDGRLALPRKGATIRVALGWQSTGLVDKGAYTVDEVEHEGAPDSIHIRARSANLRGDLPRPRTVSWDNVTLRDIIDAIAGRHGIDYRIADALASRQLTHIDQTGESDINFLTRLAERFDAIATVKNELLLFMPAGEGVTVSGQPIPPAVITRATGDTHRYLTADRDSVSGVIAHWQDIKSATKRDAVAGSTDNAKTLRETYANEADALEAARAEWARIQRGEQSFSITLARGRPDLYPETPVTVNGFKPQIDATPWRLTRVVHDMGESAYTMPLEMEVANGEADQSPGRNSQ